ncbi:MAG TPA: YihY/virulence factor BrkB family protein [Bacteroidia bacterium]|nr:YihY/virulence factor BrkB family protein [Bacteroidia bacterium]HNT80076.1 YihY/virulence factor BrkB family protein [Bacteroidia bacterium]
MINRLREYSTQIIGMLVERSKSLLLPGFEGVPLFDAGKFFVEGIKNGAIQTRAKAMAFSFFLAMFPAIIFVFTLIPYIPINGFQEYLMFILQSAVPASTYSAVSTTIEDIVTNQRGDLLSLGFFTALFFLTNGVEALIEGFNTTYHNIAIRSFWSKKIAAISLTLILTFLVLFAITLLILNQIISFYIDEKIVELGNTQKYFLMFGKWFILIAVCYSIVSFLYTFGPAKRERWRFFSAGSTCATFLLIGSSLAFNFYLDNFGSYNKLYGSIGTVMIILIWIFINCLMVILGFELNAAVKAAKKENTKIGA